MTESKPRPRKKRRALSHVGGQIETGGSDAAAIQVLEHALKVKSDEQYVHAHVHGFHTYPARLHPDTAARLISGLSSRDDVVLDPFCGSGTVLVEARRLGRRALGLDANPVAVELSWLKTRGFDAKERSALSEAARRVAESADDRRLAKAGPTRRYGPEDRELFDVHVLLELDGLAAAIDKVEPPEIQRALRLVLSSILTKLSRKPGDTTEERVSRRLAGGFAIRFFAKKSEELLRRLLEYASLLPPGAPEPRVRLGDARKLGGVRDRSVGLIVTSPPYPGVYDYRSHHATRSRWLGLDDARFESAEIGARRHARGKSYERVVSEWERDFGTCLGQMARVLTPRGRAALVLADSTAQGRALRADELIQRLLPRLGLVSIARASQIRPHFHAPSAAAFRREPRREHLLLVALA